MCGASSVRILRDRFLIDGMHRPILGMGSLGSHRGGTFCWAAGGFARAVATGEVDRITDRDIA
jgi:hypothetical protein